MAANSRWTGFRCNEQNIPATPYEACVFLDNAISHLRNRSNGLIVHEDFKIINGAHHEINQEDWAVSA